MRVLVIEDEQTTAYSIKQGLEQEAYAVDLAFDGETGLDLSLSEDFGLIILDINLPKITGFDILEQLKTHEVQTPILILTAKDEVGDKVLGLNGGADDYLVKPFAFAELLARIRALKRRPRNSMGAILSIADLTLNTNTREVKRDRRVIKLSRKEYALLEFLLRYPNQVLTKEQIINHVWSFDSDILPNTVETYIGYLRKKIERRANSSRLIHTVRGFGYKISENENI